MKCVARKDSSCINFERKKKNDVMKSTFSIIFYLKRQVIKKDGTVPVMGRITVDGTQAQFSCKTTANPDLWDTKLDISNPKEPKILCVGNNPDRQNIYGAALGLYNSRIVKLINKKGQLKSSVIIEELPTIYFKGLDNLIATARSNKVAVCLGFQDFSQLVRDYGDKEAKVVRP
ncbi:MAG TPA: hypothetical protein DHU72_07365 [Rikenellaceae bacterium]|nr:hypothetical protein [Rikenellaceae bacterium]